ncbi:hypothetical protein [Hymenobacter sp. UYCo722]|uniref:hypothetical protein n=1 Tax=Hymenobacter sp. UYCo722 TaxID=3156335 RepID=UPI00339851CB
MKNSLLILAGAAALSLTSCSQEKTTEVTTAPVDGATTTTTTTTTTAPMSDADIQARAQRIADKMVANMKITDEAMKTKIRTVYVNRYNRMNEMRTKYGTDTTGMAAANREAMMAEDQEFKTVFTDPTQYQAYESSRSTYDDSNYMDDNASTMTPADNTANNTMDNSNMETGKTKMADGSKIKVKSDGDVKMKDAEGNKLKMAGDDGTIKLKPKDGEKMKQE